MTRRTLLALPLAFGLLGAPTASAAQTPVAEAVDGSTAPAPDAPAIAPAERLGRSGALRVVLVDPLAPLQGADSAARRWKPLYDTRSRLLGEPAQSGGLRAPETPGVWRLAGEQDGEDAYVSAPGTVAYVTRVPFAAKRDGHLNGYRMGSWPTEGTDRDDRYAPPVGFIEVTRENQELQLSDHFRLRQFLTKDQFDVWPKYLALDLRLVDKLELVLQELNAMGVRALRMHVMSGFRTPQYNGPGGDGRAALSRHMYGDASDVWVDNDGDGYIDDLNGDGRADIADAEVILRAVERVELKHPELVGGAGLYEANSAHGPFVHVDVRGSRSRW